MALKVLLCLSFILTFSLAFGSDESPSFRNFYYSNDNDENQINILQPRQSTDGYRLPNDTKPIHYDISIETAIHAADMNFNGEVTIEIVAVNQTNMITLHVMRMSVISVKVWDSQNATLVDTTSGFEFEVERDFLRIPIPSVYLQVNSRYFVQIVYKGILREDDAGFYVSTYLGPNGETIYLATTKFERTDARHAFPCYDEPGIRATYTLRITHDQSYNAISNMPGTRSPGQQAGTVVTQFQKSVSMQTYLLAFVVSDFTMISNALTKPPSQLLHQVHARPAYVARGDALFALESGVKLLNDIENIVKQPYRLPKMDQISIPDFAAGAMENWGLVAYRESTLLFNKDTQPMTQQKTIATVISHEFSHMFFGNWVSPVWWDYIWLNEGFATLFEYYGAQTSFPEHRYWDFFNTEVVHYAMDRDNTLTIRPMTYYVESPPEINRLFDLIAYDKSGCVLRTMMYAFKESTFLKGLNYYLGEMDDKAATSSDLSRGIQRAVREDGTIPASVNVEDIIHSWSQQSGYPILHVSRDDNGVVTLTQERFLNVNGTAADKNKMWWLPFNFAVPTNANFEDTAPDSWMSNTQRTVSMESGAFGKTWTTDDWMIFNKKQTSYYRVNYDDKLWDLIVKGLHNGNYNGVHYTSRAQLLEDSFKLARLNRLNYDIVFGLISSMHNELEYLPWAVFNNNFGDINLFMGASPDYDTFKEFVKEKVEPYYNTLGAANRATDMLYHRQGRIIAMNYACRMGSEDCLTETSARLNTLLNANTEVEVDIRAQLYCNGLRAADADLFLRVWDKMLITNNDQTLRNLMTTALGCSENPALLETLLNTTIDATVTSYVNGDRGRVINAAFGNTNIGLEATMQFIQNNYQRIHERYDGAMPLSSVYTGMAARIVSDDQLNRFRALGEMLTPTYITQANLNSGISRAETNLVFVNQHSAHIGAFVIDYMDSSAAGIAISIFSIAFAVLTAIFI